MLDFRITTFLCVCKYLNYTKAAEELAVTQPAVSQHIRYLERYYGQKLFIYHNKTMKLTEAGEELRNAMLAMNHDVIHLRQDMEKQPGRSKRLDWGASLSIGDFLLPDFLPVYLQKHPNVQINYRVANTESLLAELDEGTLDFAFVEGNFPKKEYDYVTIRQERFICVCSSNYLVREVKELSELFPQPLILREAGSGTRVILEEYLHRCGYTIKDFSYSCTLNSYHAILSLLTAGYGISFLYDMVSRKELATGQLREIVIPGLEIQHELNFIWRKHSIYKEDYLEVLKDFNI